MKKLRKRGFQAIAQNNEKIIQKSSLAHTRSLKIINGTQNKVEKYQKYMENNQITGDPVLYRRRAFGPPPPKGGGCGGLRPPPPPLGVLYSTGIACNSIIFHIFLIVFDLIFDRVDYFQAPRVCKAIFLVFGVIIF